MEQDPSRKLWWPLCAQTIVFEQGSPSAAVSVQACSLSSTYGILIWQSHCPHSKTCTKWGLSVSCHIYPPSPNFFKIRSPNLMFYFCLTNQILFAALGASQATRGHALKENCLSLSQELSVANGSSAKGGTLFMCPLVCSNNPYACYADMLFLLGSAV